MRELRRGERVEREHPAGRQFGKQTGTVKWTTLDGHTVVKLDGGGTGVGSPQTGEFTRNDVK